MKKSTRLLCLILAGIMLFGVVFTLIVSVAS